MNKATIALIFLSLCACENMPSPVKKEDSKIVYIYDKESVTQRKTKSSQEVTILQVMDQGEMHHPEYYTHRYYQPFYPIKIETYKNDVADFQSFIAQHGYHSGYHPLIGIVTESQEDVVNVLELLTRIQMNIQNPQLANLMTEEVLTKVLAYRNLQVGQKVPIPFVTPSSQIKLALYQVNHRFDLAAGMPAFGLVPTSKEAPPILLFRGTDFSLKGSASVLADLDISGPGLTVFHSAQEEIHNWLYDVSQIYGKARIMGYSLGGSFVEYTCIYEYDLVSQDFPSIAFNEPGITEDLIERWKNLSHEKRPPLKGYITEGDLVSTVGKLIGDVYELSLDHLLEPLLAHVTVMSLQQRLYTYQLDVTLKYELDYSVYKE